MRKNTNKPGVGFSLDSMGGVGGGIFGASTKRRYTSQRTEYGVFPLNDVRALGTLGIAIRAAPKRGGKGASLPSGLGRGSMMSPGSGRLVTELDPCCHSRVKGP